MAVWLRARMYNMRTMPIALPGIPWTSKAGRIYSRWESMRHFDVVVIGAGPAGAATALSLRKNHPHLSVLLLEASDFQLVRPGETLSLEAIPLLQQLEVFDFFLEQNHRSVENQDDLGGTGPVAGTDAEGGWHLDRSRFDSMLAGYAAASGAAFMRAMLDQVQLDASGLWQLRANAGAVSHALSASFIIDASGRSARFASEIGVAQTAHDTLVCLTRIIALEDSRQAGTACLIEAFEHGWWYSAPVGEKCLAVSIMTDADISKRLQLSGLDEWSRQLEAAPQTRARIGQAQPRSDLSIRAAHTRNLASYAGNNWLAVGDAAACIDPLASQGVLRALRFGLHAGNTVGEQFGKRLPSGLQDYAQLVQTEFDNNLMLRLEDYRLEQRWAASPFWIRRHAPQSLSAHLAATGARGSNASFDSARFPQS